MDPGAITSKCIFIRHCNAVKSRYSVLDDHWPPTPIRKSPICGLVMDIICRTKRFITPATAPPTQPPRRARRRRRESSVLPRNYTTINTGTYGKLRECVHQRHLYPSCVYDTAESCHYAGLNPGPGSRERDRAPSYPLDCREH